MQDGKTSRLPNFHKLDLAQRHEVLKTIADLTREERWMLKSEALDLATAEGMVENVLGVFGIPLGLAVNFRVNDRDYLVPMAVEETSVVAAASHAAKIVREGGRLTAEAPEGLMIGQVSLTGVADPEAAGAKVLAAREELLAQAVAVDPALVRVGGGPRAVEIRTVDTREGRMLVVHLLVDVRDAMGANAVNSMVEALAPRIEALAGGRVLCRILSNLADRRLARARADVAVEALRKDDLPGEEVARRIGQASAWAEADPYRAATHNKGVMNGVDAVLIATGNDWRALEAGAHAWASRGGRYTALSTWKVEGGRLIGEVEMPLAAGTVGGVAAVHPLARIARKILGVSTARELAEVAVAAGLVQNLAALRALVTEGIQKGHMELHARNVAATAGALGESIQVVAKQMVREGRIHFDRAREILAQRLKGLPPGIADAGKGEGESGTRKRE
jgi:hydroxymethylglutaryl-CoA reductase